MSDDNSSILDKIIATQQVTHRENFKPRTILNNLLTLLTEREREIIWRRFGLSGDKEETLENIGKTFHVTRERIRQIERLAVSKLTSSSQAELITKELKQVVVELLEAEGGVCAEKRLMTLLAEAGDDYNNTNILRFFLSEILADIVAPVGGDDTHYLPGWRLRTAELAAVEALINQAQEIITARGAPIAEDELAQLLITQKPSSPLQGVLSDASVILNLLQLSANIRRNTFGEWGLRHWETISPKRMNDKIYLILKKNGKPMHFRDIVRMINEQSFDHKKAYAPTVHNELILDDKFVLVGRGIYALKEWGYKPGVVADVMVEVLKEKGQPMTRDEIVEAVLKQRLVKKGTIYLALTNKKKFNRLPDGRYILTSTHTVTDKPEPTII